MGFLSITAYEAANQRASSPQSSVEFGVSSVFRVIFLRRCQSAPQPVFLLPHRALESPDFRANVGAFHRALAFVPFAIRQEDGYSIPRWLVYSPNHSSALCHHGYSYVPIVANGLI